MRRPEYIDYIIGEDAGDTVVLDGSAMEYYILNQAWNRSPAVGCRGKLLWAG